MRLFSAESAGLPLRDKLVLAPSHANGYFIGAKVPDRSAVIGGLVVVSGLGPAELARARDIYDQEYPAGIPPRTDEQRIAGLFNGVLSKYLLPQIVVAGGFEVVEQGVDGVNVALANDGTLSSRAEVNYIQEVVPVESPANNFLAVQGRLQNPFPYLIDPRL